MIVAIFSALGLTKTIIFHNPTFYLESPILMVRCLAAYSLAFACEQATNSFFAEYEMKDAFPQNLHRHLKYISTWRLLTAGWGFKHIPGSFEIGVTAHGLSCVLLYGKFSIWRRQNSTLFSLFLLVSKIVLKRHQDGKAAFQYGCWR